MWTIETVKQELPGVDVVVNGTPIGEYPIIGRLCKQAQVVTPSCIYYAEWQDVADALNTGTPLKLDRSMRRL